MNCVEMVIRHQLFFLPFLTRSRSYSRSPFSRSPYSRSRSPRSRSRSYSYTPSRSRSRSRSYGRSPFSRRNGGRGGRSRSYGRSPRSRSRSRSYGYRRSGSPRSPPPYRGGGGGGGWEGGDGAEGGGGYRPRSRSPGGYRRSRSPGGVRGHHKPPPREPPPYEPKGGPDLSPGGRERWERDSYRQWEKEYRDWYNKYYKDYSTQHASVHHRGGRGSRERDRLTPPPRDYSPQGRVRRGERGGPPGPHRTHHALSSIPSARGDGNKDRTQGDASKERTQGGTKTSEGGTKTLKAKKLKKKKNGEELDSANQSLDRGDATPVRDEPMDELQTLTPSKAPLTSTKVSTNKAALLSGKTPPTSSSQSEKSRKEKGGKVKIKTEGKVKGEKVKRKTGGEATVTASKNKESSATKPTKASKVKPDELIKREKGRSTPTVRGGMVKLPLPRPLPPHPHDLPKHLADARGGRRDPIHSVGVRPPGRPLQPTPPSPAEKRRRVEERERGRGMDRGMGGPPAKLRRAEGPYLQRGLPAKPPLLLNLACRETGRGEGLLPIPGTSQTGRLDRFHPISISIPGPGSSMDLGREGRGDGLLPTPGSSEAGRRESDRGSIWPLMGLQVKPFPQRRIKLNRDLGRNSSMSRPEERPAPATNITTTTITSTGERPAAPERGAERDGGMERVAVMVERRSSGERSEVRSVRSERPSSGERLPERGGGGGRSVSLDRMTIAERSAIVKKPDVTRERTESEYTPPTERERPAESSKERERPASAKTDRSSSRERSATREQKGERREKASSSGDRPASTGERAAGTQRETVAEDRAAVVKEGSGKTRKISRKSSEPTVHHSSDHSVTSTG